MTTMISKGKVNSKLYRPLPWPLRGVAWVVIATQLIVPVFPQMLQAASVQSGNPTGSGRLASPPPAPEVTVNRTVPNVTPPTTDLKFSSNPTDNEITRARVFEQPILAIGAVTDPSENMDLADALLAYRNRQDPDDASAIENFLQTHPNSPRRLSLLANVATHYRQTCQLSKALTDWQKVWTMGKNVKDINGREVVDQAVADWATLVIAFGHIDDLKALLSEINGRELHGAAAVRVDDAKDAMWQLEHRPKMTFKCGPYSLACIEATLNPSAPPRKEILAEESSTNGTSLYQNWRLAQKLGLNYQIAKRQPGAAIPSPALIHWKGRHFSALTKFDNGRYWIEDSTVALNHNWISQNTLDNEASGYFLIPGGPLPAGWSAVTEEESKTIFGMGSPTVTDAGAGGANNKPCEIGMAQYTFNTMRIGLEVQDIPISYSPPLGPKVEFGVTYSERTIYESSPFTHSNLGNQWTYEWLEYISDNTTTPNANVTLISGDGNSEIYTGYNTNTQAYADGSYSQGQLTKTSGSGYQCILPDGSVKIYSQPDKTNGVRNVYLTRMQDPYGNALNFIYDSSNRLVSVTNAIGQVTTLSYGLTNDIYKITQVKDPFQRYATFQYNASGQLTNITDEIGISSSFAYGNAAGEADFINSLTTPYGTTTFTNAFVSNNDYAGRWLVATDPLGGHERVEFRAGTQSVQTDDPANLVPTGLNPNLLNTELYYRMSFFWNKETMQAMNGSVDYTKAKQYVWDRVAGDPNTLSRTLESVKQPLESARVWYDYPGQTRNDMEGTIQTPSVVAQVLDDGTTQAQKYQYNAIGKPTVAIDPSGRTTYFTYATNNVDLLSVGQLSAGATNILAQYTYNSQHLPLIAVNGAGNTTFFGYNTNGQLVAMTNALNQTVFLDYATNGYLTNVIAGVINGGIWQPLNTNSFTYDAYGRIRTTVDPLGYTLTYNYDNLDRPTYTTYMDGTYQQIVYDKLDSALRRDRNGHWTAMSYDQLRHISDTYDNAGRHTHFDWCGCGSLSDIIDPNGNTTSFIRDLQGRITSKVYPDQSEMNYFYATNNSRLQMMTDAKNQSTSYSYFIDDNLKQAAYSNTNTASVSFTYDTNYNRATTMTDGTGLTTYNYFPVASGQFGAGMLSSVSNSFIGPSSLITYNYDALGRITNRAINGVSQNVAFDMLNRVSMVTNALGSFTNAYVGPTGLIATNFYPNGQQIMFSYYSITNDERLQQIQNLTPGGQNLSIFAYAYDPVGNITNWTEQTDANVPTVQALQYDPVNQLLNSTTFSNMVAGAVLKQYAYSYDPAGNRTSEQIGTTTSAPVALSQSIYNSDNQVTNRATSNGPMVFAGNISRAGIVTVNGIPATMNVFTTDFSSYANVSPGTNVVQVTAMDYGNHSRTNNYQIMVTNNGVAETFSYDLNGNLTNVVTATGTNSYQWDAANRLVTISQLSTTNFQQSLFTYDGVGRRVKDIEETNGVAYVTNKFIWDRQALAEQRDSTGSNVIKRFFGQGEQMLGTAYFFTRDHLGSIREMTDSGGAVQARYDYDPYGRQTELTGARSADFGHAGMYIHQPSGLNLAVYRAYDASTGRWLNRDPIEETGGLNLYDYVIDNPINFYDPLGFEWQLTIGISGVAGGSPNILPFPSGFVGGGVNIGFNTSGQVFVQFQGTGMVGAGEFAGVGLQGSISHTKCPTKPGITTENANHVEGNAGWGGAGGAGADFNEENQGASFPIPKVDIGAGYGGMLGAGKSTTTTIASPPISQILGNLNYDFYGP